MAFNKVWTVLNLSTESESTIRNWILSAQLPSSFTFVFSSPFENLWTTESAYGGTVPVPYAPWTIIVSSDDDPRFDWTVYGLSWLGNKNCSIMFQPSNQYDTTAERGARMWHEMTHSMMGNSAADEMKTGEFAEFSQYLVNTGSPHQDFISNPNKYDDQSTPGHTALLIEFYTYLMHKYYPCECYNLQCGVDPCVTNPCRDGCETQTCENCPDLAGCSNPDDDYSKRVKEVLILAGVGLAVLALVK